jgi:hypothetical protein
MHEPLDPSHLHKLMLAVSEKVGYLSGESCKVILALAMIPESRDSIFALKQATCIDDNTELVQAIDDLKNFNLVKFDGKGGILINEALFAKGAA